LRALYIYNPYNAAELALITRTQQEMSTYIEVISMDDLPDLLRRLIRATPTLIPITDDLQGDGLMAEDVDGKLVVTAMLYKRLEEEDLAIHQVETKRLDNMIKAEKVTAQESVLEDMIIRGMI